MSTRKTTLFYTVLVAVASLAVGMVIASRLDLSPDSAAQSLLAVPAANSAPISGPVDALTFRTIAKAVSPAVVNIRTESHQREQELTEFYGGDDMLRRFFGQPKRPESRLRPASGCVSALSSSANRCASPALEAITGLRPGRIST